MSEVGALIIRLQAETASFREDMGKVKSDLDGLKDKSGETGSAMDHSFTESRGGLMLTEDLVGVRLPRHLNTLISQIPGVGALFANMLPIVGVALAIEIVSKLIEKHKALEEQARKLQMSQANFGTMAAEAFNKLDDKLLEAGIKADDLAHNHMAALHKQLLLIDHQSLHELAQEFGVLAEAADKTLSNISEHWYESKIGVVGVRDALETFKSQYAQLLELHKDKEAGDLLAGTLASAIKMKELMQAQQGGHGSTQSDLDAQNALIGLLTTEVNLRKESAKVVAKADVAATSEAVKKISADTLKLSEDNRHLAESYGHAMEAVVALGIAQRKEAGGGVKDESGEKAQKEADEFIKKTEDEARDHQIVMARIAAQGEEQSARHALAMHAVGIQQTMQLELDAAKKEHDLDVKADQERLKELESAGTKDYTAIRKMHDKMLQDEAKFQNTKTAIVNKAEEDREKFAQQRAQMQATAMAKVLNAEIFDHKHAAKAIEQLGRQMLETQVEQGMLALMGQETQAEREALIAAKKAARGAYSSVMDSGLPAPIAFPLAVAAGAAAFAGTMAFEQGGEIPGIGAVPIIGHGGETVVTKALSDQVKNGGLNNRGGDSHVHIHASAMDAEGMDRVLSKHSSLIHKHVHSAMRKANR